MSDTITAIRVGLIDPIRLRRDCLSLACTEANMAVQVYDSIAACCAAQITYDVLVYCPAEMAKLLAEITELVSLSVPVVVLSTHDLQREPSFIRNLLSAGIKGYIAAGSTDLAAGLACIRFVHDGGTFAPVERLLSKPAPKSEPTGLTDRQTEVLAKLRVGKANKIIAYELGMSESTVKVHVRNIMRRMGATNRTQAVYKAEQEVLALAS